jgi:hypothetical protein
MESDSSFPFFHGPVSLPAFSLIGTGDLKGSTEDNAPKGMRRFKK